MEALLDRYNQATGRKLASGDGEGAMTLADWSPTVDIEESDESYLIKADLPGVKKEDINVTFDKGVLGIQGKKEEEKEFDEQGGKRHRTERFTGRFARFFTLPAEIIPDDIDASFRDGVLSLLIPKAKEVKSKSIEVAVH
jgi:HSP20 family protein